MSIRLRALTMLVLAAALAGCVSSAERSAEAARKQRLIETQVQLGAGYLQRDQPELALENFKKALELYEEIVLKNPEDDQAYLIMGHIYLMSGDYQKSENSFQNAVHIYPDNIHEITPFYENKILKNPDDDAAYADLGYAYLILEDFLKAKSAFKNALSINPYNQTAAEGLKGIAARQS